MRCPKCHYLSFDPEPRCKNCGYDLEVADTDLALRTAEREPGEGAEYGLPDLTLRERPSSAPPITLELTQHPREQGSSAAPTAVATHRLILLDEASVATEERPDVESAPPDPQAPFRSRHTTSDLPLFVRGIPQATPALAPAPQRPLLGVRRTAPEPVRARRQPPPRLLGPLDRDLLEDLRRVEREEAAHAAEARPMGHASDEPDEPVAVSHRVAAATVDMAVLGGIGGFVFWATLEVCGVSVSGLGPSALVPLAAFLILLDIGYLLMFTAAGGQTVGKMVMQIRVVADSADGGTHVSLRQAAWRTTLTFVSVMVLGLGWLPALFGRGLALNDRFAHTRVVRA